jgi:hypothetical protein
MNRGAELPIASGGLSPEASAFAGPPPLIDGESCTGYEDLLARVCETLQPSDVLEQIWIRDIVNLVWEVFRLRRLKASLMAAAAHEGMAQVLEPLVDSKWTAKGWARRDNSAVRKVEVALGHAGLTMDAVAARTFSVRIGDFERIERMMAATEARRHAALQQLDRHRGNLALRLRRKLQEVEDAELKLVGPDAPAREETA